MSNTNTKKHYAEFNPAQGTSSKLSLVSVAQTVAGHLGIQGFQNKKDYKSTMKFEWVPIEKCWFNYERQRWPIPKQIYRVIGIWKTHCVTPLQGRYDAETDRYYISDGQQHGIAWALYYGFDSEVPVFYIESPDERIESDQLITLNTVPEKMKPYFLHTQRVKQGDPAEVALENAVLAAGCKIEYKRRSAGSITNIGHLYKARDYLTNRKGVTNWSELTDTLTVMARQWPTKPVHTDVMRGLIHMRSLMRKAKTFSTTLFEDVILKVKQRYVDEKGYNDAGSLFDAINNQCDKDIGNHKDEAEFKNSSGILSVYEQLAEVDVVNGLRPMKRLKMPVLKV
jgi:hypothetical protein